MAILASFIRFARVQSPFPLSADGGPDSLAADTGCVGFQRPDRTFSSLQWLLIRSQVYRGGVLTHREHPRNHIDHGERNSQVAHDQAGHRHPRGCIRPRFA